MPAKRIVESEEVSFDEFDEINNPPPAETDFGKLAAKAISRRGLLGTGIAFGTAAAVMGTSGLTPVSALAATRRIGFEQVAANGLDTVTVPGGYSWHIVARWGDPM